MLPRKGRASLFACLRAMALNRTPATARPPAASRARARPKSREGLPASTERGIVITGTATTRRQISTFCGAPQWAI